MTQGSKGEAGDIVVIKKYANRRLYNTRSSSYITLDHLAKMTREGVDFQVVDARSGADITHSILTQIIMDEEASGEQMLPVSFLRQLISMYGNSMQSLIPQYLEASMTQFSDNHAKLRKAIEDSLGNGPLSQIAQRNMEMFKAATAVFTPALAQGEASDKPAAAPEAKRDNEPSEIDELRAQMAAMQKKLDSISD